MTEQTGTEFDQLYSEAGPLIRRFLVARLRSESDADDLVQETFMRYRKVLENEDVENSRALLFKIARNLSVDHIRRQSRASTREKAWAGQRTGTVPGDLVDIAPDAESALASRQQLERVVAIVEGLSPKVRQAFTLHKFEGLPHKAVAERMGISKGTVEKHMIKALRKLHDGLKE